MVTVCLTNVTALILKLMISQELQSGEQERCCPFPPRAWPLPAEGKPLKSWHCQAHAQIDQWHMLKLTNPSGEGAVCPQLSWNHCFHQILMFRAVSFQVIQPPVQLMVVP